MRAGLRRLRLTAVSFDGQPLHDPREPFNLIGGFVAKFVRVAIVEVTRRNTATRFPQFVRVNQLRF